MILLVSKLHSGRFARIPSVLKSEKKESPTVMILLVSKLHAGKLVRAPYWLKLKKKLSHTSVALSPNQDKSGIYSTYTLLAVVQYSGTRAILEFLNVHLVVSPVMASVIV